MANLADPSPSNTPGVAPKRRGVLGWWGALAFNLALLGLPLGIAVLVVAMEGVELVRIEATPQALLEARRAVERQAGQLIPRDVERPEALNYLVGREVTEGDAEAARGFLMAAGAILPGPESSRLYQRLKANHSDEDLSDAAVRFLDPTLATAYMRIQSGRSVGAAGATFFLVGDDREMAQTAQRWLETGGDDVSSIALSGLTVVDFGLDPDTAAAVRVGASVLKSAKAAGRMSDALAQRLAVDFAQALPPSVLRMQLTAALATPGALADEGAAVAMALRASLVQGPFNRLVTQLRELRGAAAYTSPAGALHLIAQAAHPADFARLHLIAQAARERAAAVAKRAPVDGAFLKAAPVTWRAPPAVIFAGAFILVCLMGLLIATVLVLKHAVERTYSHAGGNVTIVAPRVGKTKALPRPEPSRPEPVA